MPSLPPNTDSLTTREYSDTSLTAKPVLFALIGATVAAGSSSCGLSGVRRFSGGRALFGVFVPCGFWLIRLSGHTLFLGANSWLGLVVCSLDRGVWTRLLGQ